MDQPLEYQLAPDQYVNAVMYRSRALMAPSALRAGIVVAYAAFFAGIGFLAAAAATLDSVPSSRIAIALAVMAVGLFAWQVLAMQGTRRGLRRNRYMLRPRVLAVEAGGLRFTSEGSEVFHAWSTIEGAERVRDIVYLSLDPVSFYPIPAAAFGSEDNAHEFVEIVTARAQGATAQAMHSTPPAGTVPSVQATPGAHVRHGLRGAINALVRDALRLAFLRPVAADRPPRSWAAVLALCVASMAIPVVWSLASVGLEGEWSWYALAPALLHVPMILAAAIVAAYAIGRPAEVPRMLAVGLLVSIVIDAVIVLASAADAPMRVMSQVHWIGAAWLALALAVYAGRQVDPGLRRLAVVSAALLLVALPLGGIHRDRSLWYEPYDRDGEDAGPRWGAAAEEVYYKQPELLSQALAAVQPAAPDRINVFFIGMAGYGSQAVFRREVDAIDRLMRERFAADGHTVRLINSSQTLLDAPIASKTSLRAALKRVAESMDRDRDVLVLYMTSHGSKDHRFALSLFPLSLQEIDPRVLRQLLDESGIRNRVVIVSSCYSGGFVKPLEGPDSLVITASAPDRNSFGCSNEADWTYFGKAYFDEALRQTRSFTQAFEMARPRIEARERQDRYDPSNPQMSVGVNIARRLVELERQLGGEVHASR